MVPLSLNIHILSLVTITHSLTPPINHAIAERLHFIRNVYGVHINKREAGSKMGKSVVHSSSIISHFLVYINVSLLQCVEASCKPLKKQTRRCLFFLHELRRHCEQSIARMSPGNCVTDPHSRCVDMEIGLHRLSL
jgi:hypothetical protein